MKPNDSIFKSTIRAFCISAFVIFGAFFGLMLVVMSMMLFKSGTDDVENDNKVVILPDANGVRKELDDEAPVILQINIEGVIGLDGLKREDIRSQLRESRTGDLEGDRVKAVLVYINSPGGTAIDADEINRAILDYKKRYDVPVYAYIEGLCASGGMYIAAAADKVYASNSSLIGSVGVLLPTSMNVSKLLDKVGVETLTITSGKDKDPLNPFRPWKEGEEKQFQDITNFYYQQFVNAVIKGRPNMSKQKLIEDYGARVFPAPEALARGYIDVSDSDRSQALKELAAKAGIAEDQEVQVVKLEEDRWLKNFFQESTSTLFKGQVTHTFRINGDIDPKLQNQFLYLYRMDAQ